MAHVVPVVLAAWQVECCQPAPAVHDVVDWSLAWTVDHAGPGSVRVRWDTSPLRLGPAPHQAGLVLRSGDLTAWWPGQDRAAVPERGWLSVEAHAGVPEQVARTRGTVRAVAVVEQTWVQDTGGVWTPAADAGTLRGVFASPRSFAVGPLPDDGGRRRQLREVGVVVEVEVEVGVVRGSPVLA